MTESPPPCDISEEQPTGGSGRFPAFRIFLLAFLACNLLLAVWRIWSPTSRIVDQIVIVSVAVGLAMLLFISRARNRLWPAVVSREWRAYPVFTLASSLLLFVVYGLVLPGAIERSKSLYVFKWIGDSEEPLSWAELKGSLAKKYGPYDMQSISLRLDENSSRGFISRDGDGYSLTPVGEGIYIIAEQLSEFYSLEGWKSAALGASASESF